MHSPTRKGESRPLDPAQPQWIRHLACAAREDKGRGSTVLAEALSHPHLRLKPTVLLHAL